MRGSPFIVLVGALFLGAEARAQEAEVSTHDDPGLGRRHRLSVAGVVLSNHSWGDIEGGGPGAALQIGYDLFFTGRQAVGVVAETAFDFGPYGGDADSMSWRSLGLRYTYLFAPRTRSRFAPFASAGLSLGRTGGELQSYHRMTSLNAAVGVEWLVSRYFSVDVALADQLASIAYPVTWWRNAVGVLLALDAQLPF